MSRLPASARLALTLIAVAASAHAQNTSDASPASVQTASTGQGLSASQRLRISDPYLEMHTGPGRGYPVFFVVPRDEWVSIELRHTDWYKVRAEGGQLGWVHRQQLLSTLAETGERQRFREVLIDDYLRRRVEMGITYGRFQSEPVLRLWGAYRSSDSLSIELGLSQVQGVYSGSSLWQLNLMNEPWYDQRWSPFFGIGIGRFNNVPNLSLVDNPRSSAAAANAVVGLRYHLSDRFVLRADYTLYSVFLNDTRSAEYRALSAGLSFFF